jgi:hypothetical protein
VGGSFNVEGAAPGRAFVALQREEELQAPIGRLYVKDGQWRGELGVAAKGFDLLLQAYVSSTYYQISLNLECEPGAAGGAAELDVVMMDIALSRFEPEPPQ